MGTDINDVYGKFRNKITDYDLLELPSLVEEEMLGDYLKSAVAKYNKFSGSDIHFDEEAFDVNLTDDQIDILATGMVYYWISPKVYDTDKMHNIFNTKDFQGFSPEKILNRMKEIRDQSYRDFRYDSIEESFLGGN